MPNISMMHPTKTVIVDMSKVVHELKEEIPQKTINIMFCPACKNSSIEIVGRCATCLVCGWSLCNA